MADDCALLQSLRGFRDSFMHATPERVAMLDEYYDRAPWLVETLLAYDDGVAFLKRLLMDYLLPAVKLIEQGEFESALLVYRTMFYDAKDVCRTTDRRYVQWM
jgi:hypothetical protein